MAVPYLLPLRCESTTGDWWYASPIEWSAANGLYDLVSKLLQHDPSLLLELTSLPRIRLLEIVWDGTHIAKHHCYIAKKLVHTRGLDCFIRSGYGGWLLYSASSAGDLNFLKYVIERDNQLVVRGGEYSSIDFFYAAARSKSTEILKFLFNFYISLRDDPEFRFEMTNRAVHAAARGGNLQFMKEIISDCDDFLTYRDAQGSTVLHTASSTGQLEVVKFLLSLKIAGRRDNDGNTALHIASLQGHISVVQALVEDSTSIAASVNNYSETFLHTAVAGFTRSGFRRLEQHMEFMSQLINKNTVKIAEIINLKNRDGRTALHVAITENVRSDLIELLMKAPSIDLNIFDADGRNALDLLKQKRKYPPSEIQRKREDEFLSYRRVEDTERTRGTSFRISDTDISSQSTECCRSSSDLSRSLNSGILQKYQRFDSISRATKKLSNLLPWLIKKETKKTKQGVEKVRRRLEI